VIARKPETVGPLIGDLPQRHAALLILDIDEVVLQFIDPFVALLAEHDAVLDPSDFRLTGSVHSLSTGQALGADRLKGLMHQLYQEQDRRQHLVPGVGPALERLGRRADIVFLTAMAPHWHATRRRHLDGHDLPYPMIATERDKGAIIAQLHERWPRRCLFVDDLPNNLAGARRSAPDTALLHVMASVLFRPYLPALPAGVSTACNWHEAEPLVDAILDGMLKQAGN
jgi:hypothetical protein